MKAIPSPRPGDIVHFVKQMVRRDERNLRFASSLKAPPALSAECDIDTAHRGISTPMFDNDQYGDWLKAARADQSLCSQKAEQSKPMVIADDDVQRKCLSGGSGADIGLAVLVARAPAEAKRS